jgi:hypothetical protein
LRKDFMVKDEEIMQAIANQFGKAGIKPQLQFLESSVYTPRYANGEFDMAVNAWGKSLEADSVITGLRWLSENSKFYGNPQVDEAINKARATFGVPERTKLYQDADKLLRDDAVGLFTHAQSELYGTNKRYPWQPWPTRGTPASSPTTSPRADDRPAGGGFRIRPPRRHVLSAAPPRPTRSHRARRLADRVRADPPERDPTALLLTARGDGGGAARVSAPRTGSIGRCRCNTSCS